MAPLISLRYGSLLRSPRLHRMCALLFQRALLSSPHVIRMIKVLSGNSFLGGSQESWHHLSGDLCETTVGGNKELCLYLHAAQAGQVGADA